jgi:hypothetical protein
MYRGDGATITSLLNVVGSAATASTPIIDDTEWPTNATSRRSSSRQMSSTSCAYPSSDE